MALFLDLYLTLYPPIIFQLVENATQNLFPKDIARSDIIKMRSLQSLELMM